LTLNSLRMIPQWHKRMGSGERLWNFEYGQFCDNPDFVNGTLGTKTVGVMGLGQIGGRVALWCRALGSRVLGYDPFIFKERLEELGVEGVEMDQLVDECEVVIVAIPPTPSAKKILSRERIDRLQKGSLVVITTRAHAVDMEALRERIIANELAGAFDVYDKEPVPTDDLLRNRVNVVHTPHIAGRTRDANLMAAEVIADDFARILKGEAPHARLSREAIAVRGEREDLPKME
ncbi:MAG: NAD(P)-dependent oxidoreductase, partial [Candidatus Latescibacteria bacterium]|nr:NAD(P)-dependent oxidoreductase [Candidatus Latescibacterota bacterium]